MDTLKGEGPFTVFAPTDEAIASAHGVIINNAKVVKADPSGFG